MGLFSNNSAFANAVGTYSNDINADLKSSNANLYNKYNNFDFSNLWNEYGQYAQRQQQVNPDHFNGAGYFYSPTLGKYVSANVDQGTQLSEHSAATGPSTWFTFEDPGVNTNDYYTTVKDAGNGKYQINENQYKNGMLKDMALFIATAATMGGAASLAGAGEAAGAAGGAGGAAEAAATSAPGWVSAEGGAGYLGGAAADASELAGAAGAAGGDGWISAEGGSGYANGAPIDGAPGTLNGAQWNGPSTDWTSQAQKLGKLLSGGGGAQMVAGGMPGTGMSGIGANNYWGQQSPQAVDLMPRFAVNPSASTAYATELGNSQNVKQLAQALMARKGNIYG